MLRNRLAYITTLLGVFLLVMIYEHQITYMALYTIFILPFFSLLLTLIFRRNFIVTETFEKDNIFKEETIKYFFTVENKSFLPCTNVKVKFDNDNISIKSNSKDKVFTVMPFKTYQIIFDLTAKYRGIYKIGVKEIILYDFLGIFAFKQIYNNKLYIHVKPIVTNIDIPQLFTSNTTEEFSDDKSIEEDYTIISDLRKYLPTDGYKKIHWKVSARKNELISKNFQGTSKDSVTILLNNSENKNSTIENRIKIEDKIIEVCVSVLNYSYKKMFKINFNYIGSESHIGDFNYLYNVVSKIDFVENIKFDDYFLNFSKLNIKNDNIIVITWYLTDKTFNTAKELSLFNKNVLLMYNRCENINKYENNLNNKFSLYKFA
ncbi:MAG: DUF58 domain-containing protein [Defluviitaleaceae bacterium]|nr:DUF58 domain-containing protein [Defluviitaleaceae bacterium]